MLRVAAKLTCFPMDHMNRVYDPEYCSPCLNAGGGGNIYPKILIRRNRMFEEEKRVKCDGCKSILKESEIVMSAEPKDGQGAVHMCKYCCSEFRKWLHDRTQ